MDALTSTHRFSCPHRGEARVRLSSFRSIERLPGSTHPVVYRIVFDCGCGEEHPGLATERQLDWEPLGLEAGPTFLNLMTSRHDELARELSAQALARIAAGEWPWSFYCYPEGRPRPVTPSCFSLLALRGCRSEELVAVAVRCPVCDSVSINVVSQRHVDLPFWNDAKIGVVEHVFRGDAIATIEAFRAELHGATFDERRLALGP